jgi:hypothetical protein
VNLNTMKRSTSGARRFQYTKLDALALVCATWVAALLVVGVAIAALLGGDIA